MPSPLVRTSETCGAIPKENPTPLFEVSRNFPLRDFPSLCGLRWMLGLAKASLRVCLLPPLVDLQLPQVLLGTPPVGWIFRLGSQVLHHFLIDVRVFKQHLPYFGCHLIESGGLLTSTFLLSWIRFRLRLWSASRFLLLFRCLPRRLGSLRLCRIRGSQCLPHCPCHPPLQHW